MVLLLKIDWNVGDGYFAQNVGWNRKPLKELRKGKDGSLSR